MLQLNMKNKISYLLFLFGIISLSIGFYQIIESRIIDSLLSVVYSIVFFIGGFYSVKKF